MATEFRLPEVGEKVATATVVNVLVKEGDVVKTEQPVIEIETEKATLEVPSTVAGKITHLRVKTGDEIAVGAVVFVVDEGASAPPAAADEKKPKEPPRTPEAVQKASVAAKAAVRKPELEHEAMGVEEEVLGEPGSAEEEEEGEEEMGPPSAAPASPSVRRLAREIGVEIDHVKGTGPGGRITPEDVKAHAQQSMRERVTKGGTPGRHEPLPDFARYGEVERKAMSSVRRITAERLSLAWATIPHVHQFDTADITELEQLRQRYNESNRDPEGKLTMTAILLKVLVNVLKKYPQFNASLDLEQKDIVYKHFYHIGVAVDTERGLLVPVIRDADQKSIAQLARELNEMARRARAGKLGVDEMKGGTFTLTNLGGIGGTNFTPIINPPEVAILGVARTDSKPVVRAGTTEIRLLLPLCLGYDHRVIDGADGARFLRTLASVLSNPLEFLVDL